MSNLLRIENLSIAFRGDDTLHHAVNNLDLEFNSGELLAIVGESGSGKSLTALSILGLLPRAASMSGSIFFNGVDIAADKVNNFRGKSIGMIFQEPMTSLNPVIRCGEQVAETIMRHLDVKRKDALLRTIELFKLVELPEPEKLIDRYPHELSGGQKQRVMIAIAISCNPSLLIADEPTTALDVKVQSSILDLLKKINREQSLAVMLITHDLGVVADVADRIIVMRNGRIVEEGIAKEVLNSPAADYTRALLECRPASKSKHHFLPVITGGEKIISPAKIERQLPSSEVILDVKNLSVTYNSRSRLLKQEAYYKAVNDVSFSVPGNSITGIVGESGCGKTTLGKAILRLVTSTSGEILFENENIAEASKEKLKRIRRRLQVVFQDPYSSLNPSMKIGEAIKELLTVHGIGNKSEQKKEVIKLLERLELDASAFNRYPHEFSGGQRQRICIARALITKPSFVIFDESVSALDVSVQAHVLNLINSLRAEMHFSALFISHDLAVVHYISDNIIVMQNGAVIESGTADDVFFRPQAAYTQSLIQAIPGKDLQSS